MNLQVNLKKKKGLKAFLRKNGEPPVLTSSGVNLEPTSLILVNLMQNKGFFHASVKPTFKTDKKKRTTAILT